MERCYIQGVYGISDAAGVAAGDLAYATAAANANNVVTPQGGLQQYVSTTPGGNGESPASSAGVIAAQMDAAGIPPYASPNPHQQQHNPQSTNQHNLQGQYTVYPASGAYTTTGEYYAPYVAGQLGSPIGGGGGGNVGGGRWVGGDSVSGGSLVGSGGPHSPSSIDDETNSHLPHTTRASPATIQWLLTNYETAEGVSLPRCTLYNHYLRHCQEHKLDPVNAASFGKLIRSVFLGLRTRRLGTRGNSKYHYYGIRIKPDSPLNRITEENIPMAMRQQPTHPNRRRNSGLRNQEYNGGGVGGGGGQYSGGSNIVHAPQQPPTPTPNQPPSSHQQSQQQQQGVVDGGSGGIVGGGTNDPHGSQGSQSSVMVSSGSGSGSGIGAYSSGLEAHKSYIDQEVGIPECKEPPLDGIQDSLDRLGLDTGHFFAFLRNYRAHCEEILMCVKKLHFSLVERTWRDFWQVEDTDPSIDEQFASIRLTQAQIFSLCTIPVIQDWVRDLDFTFYQSIVQVLIPNVLKHIPSPLTQGIRNFAKGLESGLCIAMQGAPEAIQKIKLRAVSSLAQILRRYTSLNHLAQAARAVLQNPSQIQTMLSDLNRVDFSSIQEQASWVCRCDQQLVEQLEKDFKLMLSKQKTLEEWASWLEAVLDQSLALLHNQPFNMLTTVAKQFLLKWSFYSSMVIRDLTLRSAASFGSFHLIRLLYDEYMFYLVEQRLSKISQQTAIAVMAQFNGDEFSTENLMTFADSGDFDDASGGGSVVGQGGPGNVLMYSTNNMTIPISQASASGVLYTTNGAEQSDHYTTRGPSTGGPPNTSDNDQMRAAVQNRELIDLNTNKETDGDGEPSVKISKSSN